jgi:hypothetical protein
MYKPFTPYLAQGEAIIITTVITTPCFIGKAVVAVLLVKQLTCNVKEKWI